MHAQLNCQESKRIPQKPEMQESRNQRIKHHQSWHFAQPSDLQLGGEPLERRHCRKKWRLSIKLRHILRPGSLLNLYKETSHKKKDLPCHRGRQQIYAYMGLDSGQRVRSADSPEDEHLGACLHIPCVAKQNPKQEMWFKWAWNEKAPGCLAEVLRPEIQVSEYSHRWNTRENKHAIKNHQTPPSRNERSQSLRPHVLWFHLHDMSRIGKVYGEKVD